MSDFDDVLERLVTDPAFQAALRADPEAALRGYRLEPEERALLAAQLDSGPGADHSVEDRISKSGIFGLVGPVVSGFGLGAGGSTGTSAAFSAGVARDDPARVEVSLGEAEPQAQAVLGVAPSPPPPGSTAVDYHTWVDADGDGRGDQYRAVERAGGGVDIHVDQDGDGAIDFIGHDYNRDGLVDNADYDTDRDGTFDRRLVDVDGDGWMDQSLPYPQESQATLGSADESKGGA